MKSVARCTSFISVRTQPIFRRFFAWLGRNIYLHYCLFISLGLGLTLLSVAAGVVYFQLQCKDLSCTENRSFYLWIPRETTVWSQYQEIIDLFGTYPSKMALLLRTSDSTESIIDPSNLDISFDIFESIDDITLDYDNKQYIFEDICLRSYPASPVCDSTFSNFFGYFFNENFTLWMNESTTEELISEPGQPIDFFLGGLQYEGDTITGASALTLVYELEGSTNATIQDIVYEYMGSFQTYWEENGPSYSNDGISVAHYTDRSFDDEISRVISSDMPVFGLALVTMAVYLMFTLGKISCVAARPWLAFSAIWVMLCALVMGFCISICIGTIFNTLVMLVPFILLGVGVDDMIILVDSYDASVMPDDDILKAHVRLGNALASSGLSISLTSFCSSMAFFVGSATDIPSISSFCVFAAWSFLANYLLQFLLFVPLMVIDDKRIRNKKNFCCPCFCSHDKKLHQEQIKFYDPEKIMKNNGAVSSTKYKKDETIVQKPSLSQKKGHKCTAEFILSKTLYPLLIRRLCRIVIIVIFLLVLACSIYASRFVKTESDASKLIPDDSFVMDYIESINEVYEGSTGDELQIIVRNQDFSDANVRSTVHEMMAEMESQKEAIGTTHNWLTEFELWLGTTNANINDLSSAQFYGHLQNFTQIHPSSLWQSEIIYDSIEEPSVVAHTRFMLRISKAAEPYAMYPQYQAWNSIYNHHLPHSGGYAFVPEYCFAYLTNSIVGLTIDNMIFAGIGVFGVLILLLDLRMAAFILVIVAMIDINLFGYMYLLGISLDTLSYSQCVMAVGLTVDYVIHISHAITDAKIPNKLLVNANNNEIFALKLKIALSEMGASVIKGSFTTFLGAGALILSKSQAFRIFFYMFSGIIIIAVAHGIVLTPALLGEFKFIYLGIDELNEETSTGTQTKKTSVIAQNLTFAHSAADSHASDFNGDADLKYTHSDTITKTNTNVSIVDNINPSKRKSLEVKRPSIQMTNFQNSKDSDDSSFNNDHFQD